MGDENPIRTLGDYSRPSHEGYRNTIELPDGNNVVPLRSDTIRLVQNGWSFHGLWSKDPNQHLKDFIKLVDSLELDVANRERTRLTSKLRNDILMFQQHQGESLSEAWTHIKDLLQKDLALYDNESSNGPRDFAKPVKAISLPQDVPSTFDRRLIELENQVQWLMEAHLVPKSSVQVNKIGSSCEICSGPHDTQYCLENLEQAFVDYASSCTDEAKGEQNRNSSSPKHVHFINKITIIRKEDEPKEEEIVEPNHDIIVQIEEKVGEELSRSKTVIGEGESRDIKQDNLGDRACRNTKEVKEVGEWMKYEEPLDLVDTRDESVYEYLIEKMSSCSLSFDFRIEKGDPSTLKIP
ncbi:hypothetical protein Tco_0763133 [Tanacetum coccineum]